MGKIRLTDQGIINHQRNPGRHAILTCVENLFYITLYKINPNLQFDCINANIFILILQKIILNKIIVHGLASMPGITDMNFRKYVRDYNGIIILISI